MQHGHDFAENKNVGSHTRKSEVKESVQPGQASA